VLVNREIQNVGDGAVTALSELTEHTPRTSKTNLIETIENPVIGEVYIMFLILKIPKQFTDIMTNNANNKRIGGTFVKFAIGQQSGKLNNQPMTKKQKELRKDTGKFWARIYQQ
jgi:hypothetical protein